MLDRPLLAARYPPARVKLAMTRARRRCGATGTSTRFEAHPQPLSGAPGGSGQTGDGPGVFGLTRFRNSQTGTAVRPPTTPAR